MESIVNKIMGVKRATTSDSTAKIKTNQWDWMALLSYKAGTLAQIGLLLLTLWGMNQLPSPWGSDWVAIAFFTLLSLRSRLFSPLDNTRSRQTYSQVIRPNWAPPPLVFPIVWMAIAVLRVISTYIVWQVSGENFLAWPIVIFVIHLAVGDTWNTIFTVQGRLGAGVVAVITGPWLSAIILTIVYGQVKPLAGAIIAPSVLWLTVATALVISIWRLNGSEPLYPVKYLSSIEEAQVG